jgi:hypothetical protein
LSRKDIFSSLFAKKQKKTHFYCDFDVKNLNFFNKVLTYTRWTL